MPRAKILDTFVALVQKEIAHFEKRLERVDDLGPDRIRLSFKDGKTVTANCVIRADGVQNLVRTYLLGEDQPAKNPTFSGSVAYIGKTRVNHFDGFD